MTVSTPTTESTTPVAPYAAGTRRTSQRLRNLGLQFALLLIILGAWQFAASTQSVSRLLLPLPADVWSAATAGFGQAGWASHLGTTMQETFIGFGWGVLAGLLIGALFAFVEPLRTAFYPFIVAFMSFPKIAIAPLLLVAFGYGIVPKIIIAGLLAFFPVMTAATAGLSQVDRDELNLMKALCASKAQELRYLRLPNAMSHIFPSLDLALIGALLGAVAAELIGASSGLGYLLAQNQSYGNVGAMYAILIILAAIGYLMHMAIGYLHRVLPRSIVPKAHRDPN